MNFINCESTVNAIIDFIRLKKPGMYLRFGDGDFVLSQGQHDMLCIPTEEIKNWMKKALSIRDKNIMMCVPYHCKEYNTVENGMFGGILSKLLTTSSTISKE